MDYPFYYNGQRAGTLKVSESGLYTVFSLSAENIDKKMLRISVYGDGREYCIGVAEAREKKINFEKKLSRNAMKELPDKIEYAAETGKKSIENSASKTDNGSPAWKKRPDGSLVSNDGISDIVALPAQLRKNTGKERIKIIDGQSYILFRY